MKIKKSFSKSILKKSFLFKNSGIFLTEINRNILNFAGFIARRIAFNHEKSFSRFIMRLCIGATAVSVMIIILAVALGNGFQQTVSNKVFSFWGHIHFQSYETARVQIAEEAPLPNTEQIKEVALANPAVKSIQTFATKNAILKSAGSIEGILFKGIGTDYHFENIQPFLREGRWVAFNDSTYSNEINISVKTAEKLNLKLNDEIVVYFIQPDASPRARKLTIVGLYKTGISDYDELIALGDIKLIQRMNNWEQNQVGGYELFLYDYTKMAEVSEELFANLPNQVLSLTIEEIYEGMFDWLNVQTQTIQIVLIIMIAIAALNLITCLLILVLERTRMAGILKALGATNKLVRKVFLYQGCIIALIGIGLGNLIAFLLLLSQHLWGWLKLPEDHYYISKAEIAFSWEYWLLINGGTILLCFLTLLIPLTIVRKIQPLKAIQFN